MSENNVNFDALEKLNAAFNYAEAVSQRLNIGGDTVLYLENGQKLTCRYSQNDRPKDLFHFRRTRTETQKQLNNETRELFKQMVIDIFGTSIDDVPKSVRSAMELSKFDNTGRPLTARRVMAVNKAILSAMKGVNRLMGLSGAAAGKIATIVANGSGILNAEDPANELQVRSNRHAKAQFTTQIAKGIGVWLQEHSRLDDSTGALIVDKDTQFYKDLQREEIVTLKGKRMTVDPDKSRDELVQFITGRKKATFEQADNQTKIKACILMNVIHQGTYACVISGVGHAFDPQGKVLRFTAGSMQQGLQETFSLSKDKEGNIKMAVKVRFTAPFLLSMADKEGKYTMKKTDAKESYAEYKADVTLPAADMDKLSSADWSKFNFEPIDQTEKNKENPNRFEAAANLIADEYKFTGDMKVSCRLHAQEIYDIR